MAARQSDHASPTPAAAMEIEIDGVSVRIVRGAETKMIRGGLSLSREEGRLGETGLVRQHRAVPEHKTS